MKRIPSPIFVEVIVRADRGHVKDLKVYTDAAIGAVVQAATDNHVFCGAIGRRGIVSRETVARHMRRHGFYGKVRS